MLKHLGYSMAHRVITTRWLHIHKRLQFVINLYLWLLKYPRANKSPNLFLQKCKKQHLDKLKEVKTPWVLNGTPSSYHLMIAYHTVIKSCNLWIMLDLWPLKYPCANISPNLFLQKCKQQHLDKLTEVKTPWVLDGASNGGHSMITNLLPQLTKSNILWFLLDFWPLQILAPTWNQLHFFRNASSSTEIY